MNFIRLYNAYQHVVSSRHSRLIRSVDQFINTRKSCTLLCFIFFYIIVSLFQMERIISVYFYSYSSIYSIIQLLTGKIPGIPIMHQISKVRVILSFNLQANVIQTHVNMECLIKIQSSKIKTNQKRAQRKTERRLYTY